MARMVGFTRIIKLSWLNKTFELFKEGLAPTQMREELEDYLRFEISSDTNRRKTREILLLPWLSENASLELLRPRALELASSRTYEPLTIHWGMLLVAYPLFGDLVRLIGKICEYQDEFSSAQLKSKILDEWGERATVVKGSEKILASLNAIGVVQRVRPGRYILAPRVDTDEEASHFLLQADMLAYRSGYRAYSEMQALPEMFPFSLRLSKERIMEDARFSVGNFGREFTVSLRNG